MTVLRKNADAISNYFDRITRGIGHRGSSFTDLDSLHIAGVHLTHDKETGRCLVQEFKHEGEELSAGQRLALEWLAYQRNFTVWVVVKRKDGRIGFTDLRSMRLDGQRVLSEAQYRDQFAGWWERTRAALRPMNEVPSFSHGRCSLCGVELPQWPQQTLAKGQTVCVTCWRRHNAQVPS